MENYLNTKNRIPFIYGFRIFVSLRLHAFVFTKTNDLVATEQWIINPSQAPLQVLYAIL
jgi:hypothetical protein